MAVAYLNGKRRQLSPTQVIGKGGEADIYNLGDGTVLKLYKRPDDPDYTGNPAMQQGAAERLDEQQRKLPAFPRGLPAEVVVPLDLAYDKAASGRIAGYTMRYLDNMEVLLRLGDRQYREQGGIDGNRVVATFRNLHQVVQAVHKAGLVIGDFNDLNVLVDAKDQVFLVDADSMQFGSFFCRAFTTRFLDPLNSDKLQLTLRRPHTQDSDWYAFSMMLFQSLLFVGPYGGVHKPARGRRLQHDDRVLNRLTIFDKEVVYPKPALPYDILPDDVLECFRRIYEDDQRGVFPLPVLGNLRWTTCVNCNAVHARSRCPACAAPGVIKQTVTIRGNVTITQVFRTSGTILNAVFQGGRLRYLYHENGAFRREGDKEVVHSGLDPELRFRINKQRTLMGKQGRLFVFSPGQATERMTTDTVGQLPVFDTNEQGYFWIQDGQLVRNDRIGTKYVGDVLTGRTLFWTGPRFGFGFYQAGQLTRAFVFDVQGRGLNDQVPIQTIPGQLIDATCVFSDGLGWFMVSTQEGGQLLNRCYVVNARGEVLAEAEAVPGDDSWLAHGIRGHFAAGSSLFVSTDSGIVRVTVDGGTISVAQTFPDTEPYVDTATKLLPGDGGIYAVSAREIVLLKIK